MNPRTTAKKAPVSVYLAATVVVFCMSLSAADSIGFVPCQLDGTCDATDSNSVALSSLPQLGVSGAATTTAAAQPAAAAGVLPTHITIPAASIDLPVQNPTTRDVDTLDNLLKQGPARYVDSAALGQDGNIIIFAHTSHLPIVKNKMFQAFNNIPDLQKGDLITLTGDNGTQYLYAVDAPATRAYVGDGTTIPLSAGGAKKLTLVTCDTLTGKSARFILTATYVGTVGQ